MKSYKLILGAIAAMLTVSCEDRMNYKEVSQYDKEYVKEAFGNVMGLMTAVYRNLDYDFGKDNYYGGIMLSSATDESQYATPESSIETFWNGSWSPTTPVSGMWSTAFEAITYCNEILDEFQGLAFDDLQYNDDYEKQMHSYKNIKWEARWARAYFYFNLVRQYGDVPLKDHKMTADEANQLSRNPADQIFAFINSECDAIKDEIIEDYSDLGIYAPADGSIDDGRPDKLAVLALKARSALYHASPLFNKENNKDLWKAAAQANKELIDYAVNKRQKHLAATYDCLWAKDNYQGGESTSEIIFTRRVGDINTLESGNFPFGVIGGTGGNCPTQNLVDAYDMQATGKSINEIGSGYNENNPYDGRDPRFYLTIVKNGDEKWPSYNTEPLDITFGGVNGEPLVGATPTGYYLKKLLHASIDLRPGQSKKSKDKHTWITFRLAEFYLNYAEAVFNYTDNPYATSSDFPMSPIEAVNLIRERVEMPGLPNGLSGEQFKAKYEKERFVELAFEGHRFWDVRRWKEAPKYFTNIIQMKLTKNADGTVKYTRETVTRNWDDKMYLFPIPVSDILKNTNLSQNPGW